MNILTPSKSLAAVTRSKVTASTIALALCLSASPAVVAAQDRSSVSQTAQQQGEQQTTTQSAADSQQGAPPPAEQSAVPPPAQNSAVPETLTLPAGTVIPVRTTEWLSSDRNHPGDTFSATLEQPLVANGWVVARRGQSVIGRVAEAQKAGHGRSDSHLGLELGELILIDGQQVPVSTQLSQRAAGGASQGQKVGTVAATTAIGATIGAIAGRGTGAAIGAGIGAGAGIGGVMATRGRPTVVPPETVLTFTLQAPLQVSTAQSQVAFQPVSQRDYGRDQDAYARPPASRYPGPGSRYFVGSGYGYPAPYYYGYCSPYGWACYPYPAPLYLGFGFGFRGGYFRR